MGHQPVLHCHHHLTPIGDKSWIINPYNADFITYKSEIVVTVKHWMVSYDAQKMCQGLKDILQTPKTSQNIISFILRYLKILKKSRLLLILRTFPL